MTGQPVNILEFITHPELLNDQTMSVAQRTFLKATYGLPLTLAEREIYQRATGRCEYVSIEQNEVTLIAGRRAGKKRPAKSVPPLLSMRRPVNITSAAATAAMSCSLPRQNIRPKSQCTIFAHTYGPRLF